MPVKKNIDFEKMSVKDLEDMQMQLSDAMASVKSKRILEVKTEIENILSKEGLTFDEIFGTGKGKRFPNNPPKYRNPDNPEQSWSGKGKRPGWLVEKINAGHDKEDFRIV